MIRKYLLLGKQIQLSSTRHVLTDDEGTIHPIEIMLPIETYWKAEEIINRAEYQLAAGEDPSSVQITYKNLLKMLAPHCVHEKDRSVLYDKLA